MDRYDVRRLQKAAREKDTKYLFEWATDLERRYRAQLTRMYDEAYDRTLADGIETILVAVVYTLYFSEETQLRDGAMQSFMEDMLATLDCYRTGEYSPTEFKEQLASAGVQLDLDYDYTAVYKDKLKELDDKIKEYDELCEQLRKRMVEDEQQQYKETIKTKV